MNHRICLAFVLCSVMLSFGACAQASLKPARLGLNYGKGSFQGKGTWLDKPDYIYEINYLKLQINYALLKKQRWGLDLHFEPGFYHARHQLLNAYYIMPDEPDFEARREKFTKPRSFQEYALNVGILLRYSIFKQASLYALGSVGPMVSTAETERLAKGFAFSDIVAGGISYKIKRIMLDARYTLRHTSNAGLNQPNHGHNSRCIETGISFEL